MQSEQQQYIKPLLLSHIIIFKIMRAVELNEELTLEVYQAPKTEIYEVEIENAILQGSMNIGEGGSMGDWGF